MIRISFFASLVLNTLVLSAPVPKVKLSELAVLPMATDVLQGEVLKVYVRFVNRGPDEVYGYDTLFSDPKQGTTIVEVRGPSDSDFRRPYDLHPLDWLKSPELQKRGKPIYPGTTSECPFFLPWPGEEKEHPVFYEAGKWRLRARVLLHGGLEKTSEEVTVSVAKRTADETEKFKKAVSLLEEVQEQPNPDRTEQFRKVTKLIDDLGPCYTADINRSNMLTYRLGLAHTGKTNENETDLLKEIDTHAERLPTTHRSYIYCHVAEALYDRKRKDNTLESLELVRKYAERADSNMHGRDFLLKMADQEEKRLKAAFPGKDGKK